MLHATLCLWMPLQLHVVNTVEIGDRQRHCPFQLSLFECHQWLKFVCIQWSRSKLFLDVRPSKNHTNHHSEQHFICHYLAAWLKVLGRYIKKNYMKAEMLIFSKKRSLKGLDGKETLGKRMLELLLVVFCIWGFCSPTKERTSLHV